MTQLRVNRQATEQKIFAIHIFDRGFTFRIYKEPLQISKKYTTEKMVKNPAQVIHKRGYSNGQ